MASKKQPRKWLSTSNTTNLIMIVVGGFTFLAGGSAVSLPGLIALLSGGVGLIKNYNKNKPDKKMPWFLIISLVLLGLGLVSLLTLVAINPVEQIERAKQLQ